MNDLDKNAAIDTLNRIMETELAGVVRYTHYSLMIYGVNRIPIVSWLKGIAEESLAHAHRAGELATLLGGIPRSRSVRCSRPQSTTLATFCARASNTRRPRGRPTTSSCVSRKVPRSCSRSSPAK